MALVLILQIGKALDDHAGAVAAIVTIFIASFTYTLWDATRKLFQSAQEQSSLTRESIELARREFASTHRPHIRVKHLWRTSEIWNGEPIIVDLVIKNIGNTEAAITVCNLAFIISERGKGLPPKPPCYEAVGLPVNNRLKCGISLKIPGITNNYKLTDEENVDIRDGRRKLYCVGSIEYTDAAGNLRTTAFCRYLKVPQPQSSHLDLGCFVKEDNPDYEYQD